MICIGCGVEFEVNPIGTPPRFCKVKCGQRFRYHNSHKQSDPQSPRNAQKTGKAICVECGIEFRPKKFGRPPIYCGEKCNNKARDRRGGEKRRKAKRASCRNNYANNRVKIQEKRKQWIAKHPEKPACYARAYRDRHPEIMERDRLNTLEYRKKNRAKVLAQKRFHHKVNAAKEKEYRRTKREHFNEYARVWQSKKRDRDREGHRKKCKEWRQRYPETYRAKQHRRRTRKTNAGGNYTAAEWNVLLEACQHRCLCCGRDNVKLTVDHIIPVSMGGTSNIDNIQPLCMPCNARKNNKAMDYRSVLCR